ncbi:hypothetical protein GGR58DRAFT_464592 [Xylaria digitata]|nr:hypothetical protein GGR58DRAFT_464592 [Xylaria digitata]
MILRALCFGQFVFAILRVTSYSLLPCFTIRTRRKTLLFSRNDTSAMDLFILTCLLGVANAESVVYGPKGVAGSALDSNLDTYSLGLVTNAQQHPNVTRGVAFKPFELAAASHPNSALADLEWTWRINVTDFAAPNAIDYNGNSEFVDPHIVSTSYDFNWSGPQNLSAQLNGTATRLCLTVADYTELPANVTDAYTEEDTGSTSCVSTLGQACVDAILASGEYTGNGTERCKSPGLFWDTIPECRSTFGYASAESGSLTMVSFSLNGSLTSGDGWWGQFSATQNGSASPQYYSSSNLLYVALFNPLLAVEGSLEDGFTQGPQLLCMRVNTTDSDSVDTTDPGNGDTTDPESAGSRSILNWTALAMCLVNLIFVIIT